MAKLVRLKPLDVKKGHVIQRYNVFSTTFDVTRGWYRVADQMAEYLSTVHQIAGDDESPLAFDVFFEEEAKQFEAAEKKRQQQLEEERARAIEVKMAATLDAPNDLSSLGADLRTEDLRDSGRRSRPTAGTGRRT